MKLYMSVIYLRRMKKAGYFNKSGEPEKKLGVVSDFTKLFGTEVRD